MSNTGCIVTGVPETPSHRNRRLVELATALVALQRDLMEYNQTPPAHASEAEHAAGAALAMRLAARPWFSLGGQRV